MAKSIFSKVDIKKIILFALVIRLLLWPWIFHGDVSATYWWGKFASEFGLKGFYDWLNFGGHSPPDQPIINIYYDLSIRQLYLLFYHIFWFIHIHSRLFPGRLMQWYFDYGNQFLLKLPMIISDLFLIYFSYKFIEKNFNLTKAKTISLILAFYPPYIYNSAVWGSGDSIVSLFALLGVYLIFIKKYYYFMPFYLLSILYKSSLLIWAPIFLVIIIKNKISLKSLFFTSLFSLLFIFLICLPFNPKEINPLVWFFQTMVTKILPGFMPHLTAYAMNFWALFYGFKLQLDNIIVLNLIPARLLSLIICLILYIYILYKFHKNYSIQNLLLALVNITLVTFIFMTRMHERYTFPALLPLLILCFYDRRFIKYFVLLSVTHSLNVYNSWFMPAFSPLITLLKNDLIVRFISLINIILTLKLLTLNVKK